MVYFITDGEYTKIGISKDVRKRLKALQTSHPKSLKVVMVLDIPDRYEKKMHSLFSKKRTQSNGEWFDLDEEPIEIRLETAFPAACFDFKKARHDADMINVTIYKDISKINKVSVKSNKVLRTDRARKEKTRWILDDIRRLLKSTKPISYTRYIKESGLTQAEISFAVKSAKLSGKVQLHNKSFYK